MKTNQNLDSFHSVSLNLSTKMIPPLELHRGRPQGTSLSRLSIETSQKIEFRSDVGLLSVQSCFIRELGVRKYSLRTILKWVIGKEQGSGSSPPQEAVSTGEQSDHSRHLVGCPGPIHSHRATCWHPPFFPPRTNLVHL